MNRLANTGLMVCLFLGTVLIGEGLYIKSKAVLAQVLLERAWATTLATHQTTRPWAWADTWPVARITLPRLGKTAIVLNGTFGEAMAFGPGHMEATPLPGQPGTAIIAAHRDTHFRVLENIEIGDLIDVTRADGSQHQFTVTEVRIVPWNASGIEPNNTDRALALVTCYPFGALTPSDLRFVVLARERHPVGSATST